MKKFLSLIATLAVACTCAFGLSACGEGKDGADGANGKDGVDGVSIESSYIDGDGNLIIKLTDGKEINCGQVTSDTQESLFYRPVVEDGETVGYSVRGIGSVSDTEIIVPSTYKGLPVTGIDNKAFYGCDWIESVTIGANVTKIGESAFSKCENIKSVHVSSVEGWCNISFADTSANPMYFGTEFYADGNLVENLVIPDSVTQIPDYAFYECKNIKSVRIGKGVTSIGRNSFYGCEQLESAVIGGKVAKMGEFAFGDCPSLKTLEIGNEVEVIGDFAFSRCAMIENVTIPSSVKSIGESAFMECSGISALNLNEGLEYIGDCAFGGCTSLTEFDMPSSVKEIGFGMLMFGGSYGFGELGESFNSVGKITLSNELTEIPDFAFSYCGIKTITLGDKVIKIDYSSFYGCEQLESLVISQSVKNIESFAFYKCPQINTVYYKGTAEQWGEVTIGKNGNDILNAEAYFYSEQKPTESGNFWHLVNGTPTKW